MNDSSWKKEKQNVCVQSSTGPIITRCHSEGFCQPKRCLLPLNSCSFPYPHPLCSPLSFFPPPFCRFQLFLEWRMRRVLHQLSGCWEVARRLDPTFLRSFSLLCPVSPFLLCAAVSPPLAVREHTCSILAESNYLVGLLSLILTAPVDFGSQSSFQQLQLSSSILWEQVSHNLITEI